jgi:SAM-dependent methyltransferase
MAHFQQKKFVEEVRAHFPDFFGRSKVLEVGSWNVTGTVRDFFLSSDYLGVDVATGPCVDFVGSGETLDLPTGSFDVVISCECFEHNPFWLETFVNMARMLRPGGLFVFTCAGVGRGEHGTSRTSPSVSLTASGQHRDYYRNLEKRDFEDRIDLKIHFAQYAFFDNRYSKDLYFVGVKTSPTADPALAEKFASLRDAVRRIRLDKPVTLVRALSAHGEWWLKWSLSRLLGEPRYHDFRHLVRPRSLSPGAPAEATDGREPVERGQPSSTGRSGRHGR